MRLATPRSPTRRTALAVCLLVWTIVGAPVGRGALGPLLAGWANAGSPPAAARAGGAAPADPFAPVGRPGGGAEPGGRGGAGLALPAPAPATTPPAAGGPAAGADRPVIASGPLARRSLTVRSGAATLSGTLLLPPGPGPFPGVVLLPAAGAAGRRQAAVDARMFAEAGIAAYTYRRPAGGGAARKGAWRTAPSLGDEVGYAVAAVATLRRQPEVDAARVGVWGVGRGAWLAPFVGEHADVAFLILLNGSATPLGQEEVWQAGNAARSRGYSATAADAAMRGARLLVSVRPVLAALMPGDQAGLLQADPSLDPARALESGHAPALLVYDDLNPHAPGLKSTARLLRAAASRDQPLDHVSVIGRPAAGRASAAAARAAGAAYRSVVLGWTTTVLRALGGGAAGATPGPATPYPVSAAGSLGGAAGLYASGFGAPASPGTPGPQAAADASLLLPGTSDRAAPWFASPWLQLAAVAFFLIAFGEGLVLSLVPARGEREPAARAGPGAGLAGAWPLPDPPEPARRPIGALEALGRRLAGGLAALRPGTGTQPRAPGPPLLRIAQGLVSLVDLALLVGATLAIGFLLGLYRPEGLAFGPLAAWLRGLSAVSGALTVVLALLVLLARRAGSWPPRIAVAVMVAIAAALFLPFLVYWHVPFLAS